METYIVSATSKTGKPVKRKIKARNSAEACAKLQARVPSCYNAWAREAPACKKHLRAAG